MTASRAAIPLAALLSLAPARLLAQTPGPDYRLEGSSLVVTLPDGARQVLVAPCTARSLAVYQGRLYLACGEEGVAVLGLEDPAAPKLLAMRDLGAAVVSFHRAGERLWAETVRTEARPLGGEVALASPAFQAEAAPAAPPAAAQPAAPAAKGRVVEVRPATVVLDLGRAQGLKEGDRVELFVEEERQLGGGGGRAVRTKTVAVGSVVAAAEERSEVELGRNETVPADAQARPTSAPVTASLLIPPRAARVWSVAFDARPFLALGAFGFGVVSDATVAYRFDRPMRVQLLLEPLGLGLADVGNIVSAAGNLVFSYDTRYFEIGLGAGWSAVNNDIEGTNLAADETGAGGIALQLKNVRSGLSLAQVARLGAEDGLSLSVHNTFLLYEDAFHYGGTVGQLLVPVTGRTWLLARGGGGAAGFGYGEIGLRLLAWGNGLHDSFFVSAALGGAGLFGEKEETCTVWDEATRQQIPDPTGRTCFTSIEYAGPMVGIGIEWRP